MANVNPKDAYTVEKLISAGKNVILSYNNFSILEKINDMLLPTNNIIYDYMDELRDYIVTVTLSDLERIKYKYKPKLLAFDVYGSTDLYFVIMTLNGIIDIRDFDLEKVNMFKKEHMNTLMGFIYNAEKETITINRENIGL